MWLLFTLLGLHLSVFGQVDHNAIPEVSVLYQKLMSTSDITKQQPIYFGQQNAFTEGRGWRASDKPEILPPTDLKKAVNRDPVLVGYDFLEIGDWNQEKIIQQFIELDKKGGIITLSWHMPNFKLNAEETSAWDIENTQTVKNILYQDQFQKVFFKKVDRLIHFLKKVAHIPIIFRPFHEHNYNWFWWGSKYCTNEEYKNLWLLLQKYLLQNGIHNLLYAYSPYLIDADYLARFPGENAVDILGVDIYFTTNVFPPLLIWKKQVLTLLEMAEDMNKIAAITEIGNEGLTIPQFWTDYFSWPIEVAGMYQFANQYSLKKPTKKVAYAMIWRNDPYDIKHFYGPFPHHPLNENFKHIIEKNIFQFLP